MEQLSKVFEMEFVSKIPAREESCEEVKGEMVLNATAGGLNTTVEGETCIADSGKKRQAITEDLLEGEVLLLKPEFNQKVFNKLIGVLNMLNENIGHVPSYVSTKFRPETEPGKKFIAKVQAVRGVKAERVFHVVVYRLIKKNIPMV